MDLSLFIYIKSLAFPRWCPSSFFEDVASRGASSATSAVPKRFYTKTGSQQGSSPSGYMVSWRKDQHSIMNFAVPFLKMLTLYSSGELNFYQKFMPSFAVHQILILLPLRILILLLAIIQDENPLYFNL